MKKFVYVTTITIGPISSESLDFHGKFGWELCGVTKDGNEYRYYFKRELLENE